MIEHLDDGQLQALLDGDPAELARAVRVLLEYPQLRDALKRLSAAKYGKPRVQVERDIFNRLKSAEEEKKAEEEAAKMADKEKNEKYNSLIALADKAFADKSYDQAKNKYNEALGVKPNEQHPKNKISEITS